MLQADIGGTVLTERHERVNALVIPGEDPLILATASDDRDLEDFARGRCSAPVA